MTAPDPAHRLTSLIRRLKVASPAATPPTAEAPAIECVFVLAFLQWEATPAQAAAAYARIRAAIVDLNELRVFLPHEVVAIIGERYPLARERAIRLHSALNEVFRNEHMTSLARLGTLPKREAAGYLAAIDGMTPYVVARVMMHLGAHAFPLDGRMLECLKDEGAIPDDATLADAAGWVERHVPAGELAEAFTLLDAHASDPGRKRAKPEPRPAKRSEKPAKKSARSRKGAAE